MSAPAAEARFDYSGCRVLITGGSNGIGLAAARAYADAGAEVVVTGTRPKAEDYDHDLSAFAYMQLDLSDLKNLPPVAEAVPALDIFISNAGISMPGGAPEYEPGSMELVMRVNFIAGFELAKMLRDKLAASELPGGASVIGTASMSSFFGMSGLPAYGASKAALVQLAKTLAIDWAADNIRVNNVAAGLTLTNMTAPLEAMPEFRDVILNRTPLRRMADPKEIVGAMLFLSSAQAGWITGQTIAVDGGFSIYG